MAEHTTIRCGSQLISLSGDTEHDGSIHRSFVNGIIATGASSIQSGSYDDALFPTPDWRSTKNLRTSCRTVSSIAITPVA